MLFFTEKSPEALYQLSTGRMIFICVISLILTACPSPTTNLTNRFVTVKFEIINKGATTIDFNPTYVPYTSAITYTLSDGTTNLNVGTFDGVVSLNSYPDSTITFTQVFYAEDTDIGRRVVKIELLSGIIINYNSSNGNSPLSFLRLNYIVGY